jgi:hypothetical protein
MALPTHKNPPPINPPDVLDAGYRRDGRTWMAFRTRPRHEKTLARFLLDSAVPYFLPMVFRRQRSRARVRQSLCPLLSCYVFVRSTDSDRRRILSQGHALGILPAVNQERLHRQLQAIASAIRNRTVEATHWPRQGALVHITHGVLAGLDGRAISRRGKHHLVLQLDTLGAAIRISIDRTEIEVE